MISLYRVPLALLPLVLIGVASFIGDAGAALEVPDAVSVLCVEADSGRTVYEENAGVERPPASMVKMMLMLLVSEGLDAGSWDLSQPVTATAYAESVGGSQVYLKAGETHSLGDLMHAVAVKSANDAAACVAEGLWGSKAAYLARANERARELGMLSTEFNSVHGLPPSEGEQPDRTTAHDMVLLARENLTHPIIHQWTTTKEFRFRGAVLYNTNKLLWRMVDCDGMKTGYIRAAGFCVTATAVRNDVRLIVVIMGHPSNYQRFNLAEEVFSYGFERVQRRKVVAKGQPIGIAVPVRNSSLRTVEAAADADLWVTTIGGEFDRVTLDALTPEEVRAPLEAGHTIGEVQALLDGAVLSSVPLVTPEAVEEGGWEFQIRNRIGQFAGQD